MANYAEIVGDEVRFYNRIIVDTKPLHDVLATYHPTRKLMTPRLPDNCVFIANWQDTTIYVVEKPPRMVTLRIDSEDIENVAPAREDNDGYYWWVPVPWEYYIIAVSDVTRDNGFGEGWRACSGLSLYWADHRVVDPNEKSLVGAELPNVSLDGSVCLGDTGSEEQDPWLKVTDLVEDFYGTYFNSDLGLPSGPSQRWHQWLTYGDGGTRVNLQDDMFSAFRAACRRDGVSVSDIVEGHNAYVAPPIDSVTLPATTRAYLDDVFQRLPRQYRPRLASLLRGRAEQP